MSCELKNILLIAEHHHQQLHPAMRHLLQAAVQQKSQYLLSENIVILW